ncbi:hypothetical protein FA95DRAFT_1565151 [Auriscalpium vulgare]|uniref:Uncharacterized protein n=1 Tax=Auriscalpium vulgare TaxID=40419 RepID=A0ACB8RC90_9AGAM|nr:hypothetical protein FA95DRAFT_1565151 [Auriscalpium vulgare]
MSASADELTATVLSAVGSLPTASKAQLLLDHALRLLQAGQYGHEVESYLDVYLRTPGLPKADIARALLVRGKARKEASHRLRLQAENDLQAAATLDPSNRDARHIHRRYQPMRFPELPASQRAPPEIWDRIAGFIPRYFLRTWLFVSSFYRDIALRNIFRTVDLYLGEDQENMHRSMDVFDRVKSDPAFARHILSLRVHWAYEGGDVLDLMSRIFRTVLPEFKALREFEWIGYPELQADMVQVLLRSHSKLDRLGLVGWHFDAVGVSAFTSLRRFTLRAEDDDGFADMGEVRTVLDNNAHTLTHLTLGAYLARTHSWDSAFQSSTIQNLTHLELVDTRISHLVLARVAHAHRLVSLTLHGTLDMPGAAAVVFGSDHVLDGRHTFLPCLEVFRLALVGHDDDIALYEAVVVFLRRRYMLRRLDLGGCPYELVLGVLPELTGLRVLRVKISNVTEKAIDALARTIPREMVAVHLSTVAWDKPLHEYALAFGRFTSLSMLHFNGASKRRPQPSLMSDKEFQVQTDVWLSHARRIAVTLPTIDFVGWHGEHYVVVRSGPTGSVVELKELPVRRRLDCGTGVDLGTEDAMWMERKDVPIDYERSGLDS